MSNDKPDLPLNRAAMLEFDNFFVRDLSSEPMELVVVACVVGVAIVVGLDATVVAGAALRKTSFTDRAEVELAESDDLCVDELEGEADEELLLLLLELELESDVEEAAEAEVDVCPTGLTFLPDPSG